MPSNRSDWEQWSPPWNLHTIGRYSPRIFDADSGMYEPQHYTLECNICSERRGPMLCTSGDVWRTIVLFARVHYHQDPLTGVYVDAKE